MMDSWQGPQLPLAISPLVPDHFPTEWVNTAQSRWMAFQRAWHIIKYSSSPPVLAPGPGGQFKRSLNIIKQVSSPPVFSTSRAGYTINQIAVLGVLKNG